MITQSEVKRIFVYKNGNLHWNIPKQNIQIGDIAGHVDKYGYRRVQLEYKRYRIHHLVWLYHYGYLPKMLDHINRNRDDNRLENLREVNSKQNNQNRAAHKGNSSGYKGVSFRKANNKYFASIKVDGKSRYIGYFNTAEEAKEAYDKVAKEIHGEYFCP